MAWLPLPVPIVPSEPQMVATPVLLRSPASTGGAAVPTDITRPGQDPAFAGRDLTIRGAPGHLVHHNEAAQEGLLTSLQLLVQAARQLPPPLPQFPEVVGYISTPEIPGWPARTFIVIRKDEEYEVNFCHLGPLMTQAEMATRVWETSPSEARLLKTWWWVFGKFWFRGYRLIPGFAQAVDREFDLAVTRHDITRLRRGVGRPGGDEADLEGIIDEAVLSPQSRDFLRRRFAQDEAERVDPALLVPEVQIVEP